MTRTNPTVTSVVKVKDRRHIYQYDLSDDKLVIEYRYGKKDPIRISLSEFALKELGKLLYGSKPVLATTLPDEPMDRPPGSVPKDGIQGTETAEGLTRTSDGVESGMEE